METLGGGNEDLEGPVGRADSLRATDSAATDSAATDSVATDTVATDSATTDSAAIDRGATDCAAIDAAAIDAAATDAAAADSESAPHEPTVRDDDLGFGIYVSCWSDRWRVQVSGKVDAAGAGAILDVAEVLAARQAPAVDLDLSEVTAIDASGWRAAIYAEGLLAASGGGCRLIPPPSDLVDPRDSAPHHAGHAA